MNIVEAIGIYVGLDFGDFNADADKAISKNEKLENALEDTEKAAKKTTASTKVLSEEQKKANKTLSEMGNVITSVHRLLTGLFTTLAISTGFAKLVAEAQATNNELYKLEKQLGMQAGSISAWQGAATMAGGSAEGMIASLKGLNRSISDLTTMGDATLLPFLNELGVGVLDNMGNMRDMDNILLDMSESFAEMDKSRAYSLGAGMGLDEGTIETLMQGRDALQEMLDLQKNIYTSSAQELEASRELSKQQALLRSQYQGLKVMLGNTLVPILTKITEIVNNFIGFLHRNEKTVKNVFEGLAIVIGVTLIPVMWAAAVAAWAMIAPYLPLLLIVTALGAAFILLYDDYKTWADGGESLFDWGEFQKIIGSVEGIVNKVGKAFDWLKGKYKEWSEIAKEKIKDVANSGADWLKMKGFIDENGISLDSLRNGFKNLANDITAVVMPELKKFMEILNKLRKGDFKGAFADIKNMMPDVVNNGVKSVIKTGAGAYDNLFGLDSTDDKKSLSGVLRGFNQDIDRRAAESVPVESKSITSSASQKSRGNLISDFIGKGEGHYNSVNLGKRFGYKSGTRNLTSMTVADVKAMQDSYAVNAVGKYQIIRDTMPDVIKGMKLTGKEKFDEEMQDRMGAWLFFNKRSSLGGYLKGKHNNRNLAGDEGAREWASLPVLSGSLTTKVGQKTYHSKRGATAYSDGVNKAQHSANSFETALDRARADYSRAIESGLSEKDAELAAFRGQNVNSNQQYALSQGSSRANAMISQGAQIQLQAASHKVTNNNQKQVDVNIGAVTVNSASNTIDGTVNDGMQATINSVNQMVTGMV
ncbi:phage tail tape measure protein [Acinetobacter sp. V91_7]|uniref:phage tail tape measure protein n=1 Tax=unclassified Acinetobacter TaxID=196816 RepID=UPI00287DB2FD|nr:MULTISPECIES: phage tail tape measure protein [unclassified Acinetobacter]MDS7935671.1 phage tail tape measure protein [Acinetobacter sp. V91_4B]MDS7964721.1 phage tail tape measure protein [Acinetobacter sp. V91_7]MDS8025584.1 phage tail tape measure protein [Acinetobacter sp. V91_13]